MKIRVNIGKIVDWLTLIFFLKPAYVEQVGYGNIYEVVKIILALYMCFKILEKRNRGEYRFSILIGLVIVYKLLIPIALFLQGTNWYTLYLWFKETYTIIFLLLSVQKQLEIDYFGALKRIKNLICIYLIIHTVLYSVSGIEFLGIRTRITDSLILYVTILMVFLFTEGTKKNISILDGLAIILALSFTISQWVATCFIELFILVIGYYICRRNKQVGYPVICITALSLNAGILFFRIQNLFAYIIENLLHKTITFTGRIYIWDIILYKCLNHPLIGVGAELNNNDKNITINEMHHVFFEKTQAHNQLLSILYFNGFIGIVLFIVIILYAGRKLKRCKYIAMAKIYTMSMLAVLIGAIVELSTEHMYFYVFIMALSCIPIFDEKTNSEKL